MTPQEFKAWFDGFTEAFTGVPTKAQWARVKERVAEIDGRAVTERVFVDRYWPTYYPPYRSYWYSGSDISTAYTVGIVDSMLASNQPINMHTAQLFDSSTAMLTLGRADAQALS